MLWSLQVPQTDTSTTQSTKVSGSEAPDAAILSQDNMPQTEMDKAAVLTQIREEVRRCQALNEAIRFIPWTFLSLPARQADHHQGDWGQRVEEEVRGEQSWGHGDEVGTFLRIYKHYGTYSENKHLWNGVDSKCAFRSLPDRKIVAEYEKTVAQMIGKLVVFYLTDTQSASRVQNALIPKQRWDFS